MDQDLYQTVERILTDTFRVPEDEVSPEATFESMQLDSLDLVELTMVIEEELGLRIEDDELEGVETVRDAVELMAKKQEVAA